MFPLLPVDACSLFSNESIQLFKVYNKSNDLKIKELNKRPTGNVSFFQTGPFKHLFLSDRKDKLTLGVRI